MANDDEEGGPRTATDMVRHLLVTGTWQTASKRNRPKWPGRSALDVETPITKATELMDASGVGKDALYASKSDAWSDKTFRAICKVYGIEPDSPCGEALKSWNVDAFIEKFDKPSAQGGGNATQATESIALAWKAPATKEIIARLLKVRELVNRHGESNGMMTLATDAVVFEDVPELPGTDATGTTAVRCVRVPNERPKSKDFDLASIEFPRPEIWNEGGLPWPLSLDIYLGQSEHGLYVRAAQLVFEMTGAAGIDEYRERTAWPGGLNVQQPNARTMPKGFRLLPKGPTQSPSYDLSYGKAPIGGFTAHHMIRVHNAVAGDRVTVWLKIPIADLVDAIRGDDDKH